MSFDSDGFVCPPFSILSYAVGRPECVGESMAELTQHAGTKPTADVVAVTVSDLVYKKGVHTCFISEGKDCFIYDPRSDACHNAACPPLTQSSHSYSCTAGKLIPYPWSYSSPAQAMQLACTGSGRAGDMAGSGNHAVSQTFLKRMGSDTRSCSGCHELPDAQSFWEYNLGSA